MVQIHYYLKIVIFKMYLILVFLPLISSITAGLFGRNLGPKGAAIINSNLFNYNFFLFHFLLFMKLLLMGALYILN